MRLNDKLNIDLKAIFLTPAFFVLMGFIFAGFVLFSPTLAIMAFAGLVVVMFVSTKPLWAIAILIFLIPFSNTQYLARHVLPIPGARPVLLIGVMVVAIMIANNKKSVKLPHLAMVIIGMVMAILTISVFRSYAHIDLINIMKGEDNTRVSYTLSYWFKPLIFFLPFVAVTMFARTKKHLEFITDVLFYSIFAFTTYFLLYYVFKVPDKGNIEMAWEYSATALGLHKNAAAAFYVVGFPFVLARYFAKKDMVSLAAVGMSVIAIGFLYSRTAYVTMVLTFILYLLLSGRTKYMPVFFAIGAIAVTFFLSSTVLERATQGIGEGDVHAISSGRVEGLWQPLIDEVSEDAGWVLVGHGKFSMLRTRLSQVGLAFTEANPHNMYLEQILDSGILGLFFQLTVIGWLLFMTFGNMRSITDLRLREYHYAGFLGIINYLMAGMMGRSLYPENENSFFWLSMAIVLVIARLSKVSAEPEVEPVLQKKPAKALITAATKLQ